MPPTLSVMIHDAFQMFPLRCKDVTQRREKTSKEKASFILMMTFCCMAVCFSLSLVKSCCGRLLQILVTNLVIVQLNFKPLIIAGG